MKKAAKNSQNFELLKNYRLNSPDYIETLKNQQLQGRKLSIAAWFSKRLLYDIIYCLELNFDLF